MQQKFIRISVLASTPKRAGRWPASGTTIWRWVGKGILPKPIKLGPGVTAFPLEVIEAFEQAARLTVADEHAPQVRAGNASVAARRARVVAPAPPPAAPPEPPPTTLRRRVGNGK